MSQHVDIKRFLDLAKKTLAPAALGVGLAVSPACGVGEPEDPFIDEETVTEGKEDSINKSKCGTDYPGVQWQIYVKQKLTSARMKKIASCAIEDLILAQECGIGCEASIPNPVIMYMAPGTPAATSSNDPGQVVALYAAPMPTPACDSKVDWIVKPNTFLTASKMKELVQCAVTDLVVKENCGIGCEINNPVTKYMAPVALYSAPIDK